YCTAYCTAASSSSRNNSKNMPRFSSNDMVHNHYLYEAKKKTRDRHRNSKPSVMTSARVQSTTADSKPKPRSTNHSSRSLPMSKSSCVTISAMPKAAHSKSPSANHDACITKLLKEVNLHAKIQSHKTRDNDEIKMAWAHNSSDPAPTCQTMASVQISSDPAPEYRTCTTSNELDLLFSPMFDELLNGSTKVVSKSSALSAADVPNQRQQPTTPLNNHTTPAPTCQTPSIAPTVISNENINQAKPHAENDEVAEDEFINIFSTPVQDQGET
nr:hypothetical protein [Tanacetum cinerariifolium]